MLPARVADYRPEFLDELSSSGEVLWVGRGALSGDDGRVSLHLADTVHVTMPPPVDQPLDAIETELLAALGGGGAYFFRQLSEAVGQTEDAPLIDALWRLVWAGMLTNDTFAPVRGLLGGGGAHRARATTPRARVGGRTVSRRVLASAAAAAQGARTPRSAPPRAAGRWSVLPVASDVATPRAHALGETLLERYGVVTRGSVVAEDHLGGFALAYRTLAGFEESGRVRRGYFIDGQGGAQFATSAAVDRLRQAPRGGVHVLAATDPANPFGAALDWPEPTVELAHRPARKAGAVVAIVDGEAAFYLERGGRTALVFTDDDEVLAQGAAALAETLARARGARFRVETVNGARVFGSVLDAPLRAAGFRESPQGLRFEARS
ncbi:hypothetical protein GCM10025870_04860 [Agromyces marinus]|uniref:ATP-dependent helicase Lhr and Lhr-like helicase n=1 Tax=Agromyces marinus TaxID=1389020 RepID=A0ABM8GY66_9MICO|nr:hypothetical protein GCM10025870_04860 [Agromyces marinus]